MFAIPFIGPIIELLLGIFKGFKDVEIVKYKTDGQVDIAATQAAASVVVATKDDIGLRLFRDAAVGPWALWCGAAGWDTLISKHWPWLMIHVPNPPQSMMWLPVAALTFLLGNIGFNMLRRR